MTSRRIVISRNESTHRRVVISALEVVEVGFVVIDVATVAKRVMDTEGIGHGAGSSQRPAPCVIGILDNCSATGVQDGGNIALNIGGIVVVRTVVGDGHGGAGCIVGKVQGIVAHGHLTQAATVIDVVIGSGTVGPLGSQTVCVVGVRPGGTAIGHGSQFTAMLPGVGPGAVGQHVANGIAGNGLAVVAGQQIAPSTIIGIVDSSLHRTQRAGGMPIFLVDGDIACIIIGLYPKFSQSSSISIGSLNYNVIGSSCLPLGKL